MIGNEQDSAIRNIFEPSPIPNQSNARGKMASGDTGRMNSTIGSNRSSNSVDRAIKAPITTEMTAESEKPIRIRRRLAHRSISSEPLQRSRPISKNTMLGGGNKSGSTKR